MILEPSELDDVQQAVEDRIQIRYQNKIIIKEGLCVMIKQPVTLTDKIVIHCEGAVQVSVIFEAILFRPAPGTVLQGTILSQSEVGIEVQIEECP